MHSITCLSHRPASSTTAALAGTGSTPWTSWATTGPSCATRRTGTPARADGSKHSEGPEEEPLSTGWGCPPRRARVPDLPQYEGTMALHQAQGYHCRKCSLLHLLHFCCSQWHYAQWPCWERQGALHTYAFSQTCGQTEMGVSLKLRSGRKCHFFFFFLFCLHVLHSEEQSRKSHCRSLANAIQCL